MTSTFKSAFKKIFIGVLAIVCCVSFVWKAVAVSGTNKSQIVLSFWGTNLPYQYALEHVAEEYNNSQSKFVVKIDKQDAGNYRTWMGAKFAGGTSSDILMTNTDYANADAGNGELYDLSYALKAPNPYNENKFSWADSFSGSYLSQVAYSGDTSKFYCVPTSTVSVRIMINEDMFAQYGVAVPDGNWTFSDFRRICEQFEAQGIVALEIENAKFINYMVSWVIDIFMAQIKYDAIKDFDVNENGVVETEEIVRAFTLDNINLSVDEDFRQVMEFLSKWKKYWGTNPTANDDSSENFLRQRTPMYFCGSWGVSGIELTLNNENAEADPNNKYKMFKYKSLTFPVLEKSNYIDASTPAFTFTNFKAGLPIQELGEPSDCYCISKNALYNGHLEGAIDFLYFFTSEKMAAYMAENAYMIPVVKGVEINEKMQDFLPPTNSESIKMRFNLLKLSNGIAEEYHFKQVQQYLDGNLPLGTFCNNIQKRYVEVSEQLREDNEWYWEE